MNELDRLLGWLFRVLKVPEGERLPRWAAWLMTPALQGPPDGPQCPNCALPTHRLWWVDAVRCPWCRAVTYGHALLRHRIKLGR